MLSLRKLLGRDQKFFDLLEAGAEEAKASVELFARTLHKIAAGNGAGVSLDEFIQARRKEKRIRHTMTEELSKTFVTPLEREDIEALSFALYRIPKQVEKAVERLSIYPGWIPHAAFERQAELMLHAADAVLFMVKQLRGGTNIERIREANDRLQFAEGEADKVMLAHPNPAKPEPSPLRREVRNSNLEIRNKPKPATLKPRGRHLNSVFSDLLPVWGFELVSDFELRASFF